jgi:DNA-binding HxlR family transcriptional regulator
MTDRLILTVPDVCPTARALDIIGERWTLLIIRELKKFGPRKFQDFEQALVGISSNTLSARLKRLEEAEIVERRFYEQHPPRAEYLLTERGKELIPVLDALFAWGRRHTKCAPAAKKERRPLFAVQSQGETGSDESEAVAPVGRRRRRRSSAR